MSPDESENGNIRNLKKRDKHASPEFAIKAVEEQFAAIGPDDQV
jgi:hypothetical protein